MAKKQQFDKRKFMQLAIDEMKKSIAEPRSDGKASPRVGVVLVSPDGVVLGTAHRGELRHGDHAEFTLLERKNHGNKLDGAFMFATLEPCAPGARKHPKLGCAERIVNARIKKVWVGIEDPDPTVDRKGIKFLLDSRIDVEMFDEDMQLQIQKENKDFIKQALERKKNFKKPKVVELSPFERPIATTTIDEFSQDALKLYIERADLKTQPTGADFLELLEQQQLIQYDPNDSKYHPTGLGVLLFGKSPRNRFPQAVLKVEARYGEAEPEIHDFEDALVLIPDKVEEWLRRVLDSRISREKFARKTEYSFPIKVLREAVINALVHRDYDIEGAKCYLNIDDDKIVVKSPGKPVEPIRFEDFKDFKAPSLSRNPKLMAVFNAMNFVEERGIGMMEMKSLPAKYHLPLPEITWQNPYVAITFPRNKNYLETIIGKKKFNSLNEEERNGAMYVHDRKEVSKKEYAKQFKFDEKKSQRHLSKFANLKLVTVVGKGPSTRYVFKSALK
jgi:ATP-dependent DNA helicase RecG